MVRYLGWLANTALFTLCCFLVANTANAIIAALLSQSPALAVELRPRSGPQSRTWNDRQQITQRNLFHSAQLSAAASTPAPTDEELKETELPLKLWGTIAAEDPALSWASVEETGKKKGAILAVRVGDQIQDATIVGIERRRVVLLENGNRRSLSLDDDAPGASLASAKRKKPTTRKTTTRSSRRKSARKTPRKSADEKVESPMGNPSSLYSQARILPEIDAETNLVTGLKLSAIQAGSAFEEAGIRNGEVIIEIDGVAVSDMGDSTKIMSALTDPDEVEVVTRDKAGKAQPPRVIIPPR
jgi:general secretion pathway protein C